MYQYQYTPYPYSIPSPFHDRQQTQATPQIQSNVIFPKISPETFYESARQLDSLLRVATTLSYEINNTDIGREIVEAAQKSETDKIYAILRNAGITGGLKITYTPYGITFTVLPKGQTAPIRTYASIHLTWQDLL